MYTLEEKTVGRFTVKLYPDDVFNSWEDVLCDQPIMVIVRGRWNRFDVQHDGTKRVPSGDAIYFQIEDSDWEEVLASVYGLDWDVLEDGRVRVDWTGWGRPRTFKTLKSAAKRVLEDDSGIDIQDLRFERLSTLDADVLLIWSQSELSTRDADVLLVWSQSELDAYAGTKGANAPVETVRSYLDGEVYGWTVEDADGDILDSCWGYIGDASYPLSEAEAEARRFEADASTQDAQVLEASRLDLYADA
jgi:hypothetical protein